MSKLNLYITSFSYREGLPKPVDAHGGGFIFDCRALVNPGRDPQYSQLTGCDQEVCDFLLAIPEVEIFYTHSKALVDLSLQAYLQRNFSSLCVAFGCTGGQHRSVYMAERLARDLKSNNDLAMILEHTGKAKTLLAARKS